MWGRLAVLCLIVAVIPSGFSVHAAEAEGPVHVESGYRVGPGDLLKVEAFQHSEVSGEFPVEESGVMTFPLLDSVEVAGLTVVEVARLLEELLEKDFYVDVQLQVEVKDYRSQPVTVLGEVGRPGTYYLEGRTTLLQILSEAGGVRESAGPTVELRRINGASTPEEQKVLTFSTSKLATGEEGGEVEVRVGDVISVSSKQLYFITGEVARPGQYEIARGLTLMQAISQAGGQGKFASQSVELHREIDGQKEILDFDLARIRKGKDADPPIRAGDVIIIRRRFF
jgi:polysaccharide export outer membrane protein